MTSKNLLKTAFATLAAASLLLNARADITTGLVGYWSLAAGPGNGTVPDLSGNGNTGTLKDFADPTFDNMWTTSTDPTNGWPYALAFTNSGVGFGTNTYVLVPDSPTLDALTTAKTWTLSAWVRPGVAGSSEPANAGIIAKGVSGAEAFALYISGGEFTTVFHNAAGSGTETVSATNSLVAGTWYHVAATVIVPRQSGSLAEALIYVNGVVRSGTNANTYTTVYSTNLATTIGCRAAANGSISLPFEGTIDEVRIYDRALPPSDINQLYTNVAFSVIDNGLGYWNGLAGSGGNATLDTTSLNFCTNLDSAPVGTPANLPTLLSAEQTASLPLGCVFSDFYYSNESALPVTSTNLSIVSGGVALGTAGGVGTATFFNTENTYLLNSTDAIGLKDGASPTALAQSGAGTTILTGTNTFGGGTTISIGTLQIGNGGATGSPLGSGPVTNNGTLVFNGNDSPSFANAITGTGTLTQKGSGTLSLSGANTFTGPLLIPNGTVSVNSIADSPSTSALGYGNVTLNGGTLVCNTGSGSTPTTARSWSVAAGTNSTLNVPANVTLTLSGVANGTSPGSMLNFTGGGTLIVGQPGTAASSYFGLNIINGLVQLNKNSQTIGYATTVRSGGTLQMSSAGAGGGQIYSGNTSPISVTNGLFDLNSANNILYSLTLSGSGNSGSGALINSAASTTASLTCPIVLAAPVTIGGSTSAGNITLPGVISGNYPLTYAGQGMLTLGGANTYSGGTFVTAGTLDGSVFGSIPGNITVSGSGVLEMDVVGALSLVSTLTLPSSPAAGTVYLNFAGVQNIGALYLGAALQPAGTYGAVGSGATYQSAIFNVAGGGILNVVQSYWDANHTDAGSQSGANGGGSGSWDTTSADWWVSGNTDQVWTADNVAYFAGTAGTVTVNADVTADGLVFGTPGYSINNTDDVSVLSLGGAAPVISVPAGSPTAISCVLADGGSTVGLTVAGPGTLVLTGTNTYAGGTTINGAALKVNNISDTGTSALGNSGTLLFAGGSTLSYTGSGPALTARFVTAIDGTINDIDVPAGSLEVDGQITCSNASSFVKTSPGTLILGGAVDNSSLGLAIKQGEVVITKASASAVHGLGGATSTVGTGTPGNYAELQLAGTGNFDLYSGCILTVNGVDGLFDLNGQSDAFSTLTLSGAGPYGTGVLINSNATPSAITNAGSGVVLAANATIGGSGNITLASAVSGGYALTYDGSATLALSAASSFSGGTVINAGSTVLLTNSATAAGSGTITNNGILDVGIVGNNAILGNAISGPGIVNMIETSGDNLQLGGSMSGFTGTINCPASASTAKVQILTTAVGLTSAATINVAAGGTLYVADAEVVIPCPVNLGGVGNTEAFGALRIESNAVVSGPVTLGGNATLGNNTGTTGMISGSIGDGGHGYGITKTATTTSTMVLSATNTFTGPITNSQGFLVIGGAGCLGVTATSTNYATNIVNSGTFDYASSAAQTLSGVISGAGVLAQSGPGVLTLTGSNTYTGPTVITNGSTLIMAGAGCLGVTATTTNYAANITNSGIFDYASSAPQTLSGVISGTGTLTQNGPGTLILSGLDTYTGATLINGGSTLALTNGGTINNSASINIAAGATLDLSAYNSYTLPGASTLSASGTGTTVGSTAAAIKGAASATIALSSPLVLGYTPQTFTGDATHPALYVSQISSGELNVSSSSITVSNAAASPLGVGTYSLIQVAPGASILLGNPTVNVTGTGLAPNTGARISSASGSVSLVVTSSFVPMPAINSVTVSGTSFVFSGTNGSANGTYHVLTSTNVELPLSNWTSIATSSFSPTGTFSVTNTIGVNPSRFFTIVIP